MSKDAVLELLRKDARLTPAEVATRIGIDESEAQAAIATLEADGTILGYQAVVVEELASPDNVSALIEVRITPVKGGGFDKIARRIARFDQVKSCYLASGGYDLMVVVEGAGLREVAKFVSSQLSSLDGVLSTATHFRLKTYKEKGLMTDSGEETDRLSVTP